jgi:DNA polymerase I
MPRDLLLDIDYVTVDEEAQIRLFLRNQTLYAKKFEPYFYVLGDGRGVRESLSNFGKVKKIKKSLLGKELSLFKLTVSHPSDVPKIREEVRNLEGVDNIFEHDILFARRYLIDKKLVPLDYVEAQTQDSFVTGIKSTDEHEETLHIMAFDIEVYNPKGAPRPNIDPIIMISLASNTGVRKVLTYKAIKGPDYLEVLRDEKVALSRFVQIVEDEEIDILVGYNSDQFDLPYIVDRAKVLDIKIRLGRDDEQVKIRKGRGLTESVVRGRPHVDLYPVVRRNVKLSSYVLESVVKDVLGIEKEKIASDLMWRYWDKGGEKLLAFMKYSVEDADVTLKLAEKFLPL